MVRSADIPAHEANGGVRLPHVFNIGFVGTPKPAEYASSTFSIQQVLAEQTAVGRRTLCAVVAIVKPGDLVCAECCVEAGIPLVVLLDVDRTMLRKELEAGGWERAERVLTAAMAVEVAGVEGSKADRMYECGVGVVERSELVVALSDDEPTSVEIAEFARATGRPLITVDCATGVRQRVEGARAWVLDTELEFLNRLPAAGAAKQGDSPTSLANAWQRKLSANAGAVAPEVRRLAAVPIVCTALAAVITGAAPRLHLKLIWTGLGTVLGLTAALFPAALRLAKRQALWVRLRTAAEVTRSVRALWDIPMRYEVLGPEVLPELAGMVRSLNLLKAHANKCSSIDLDLFKRRYREERVLNQMKYFSGQARKSADQARRYRLLSKVCVAAAIVLSACMFAGRFLWKASGEPWLGLLTSSLFQVATVAGALLVVHDCDRRERRYQELHASLQSMEVELQAVRTWPLVNRVVTKIERALLIELVEWRSLLQNMKMPRN